MQELFGDGETFRSAQPSRGHSDGKEQALRGAFCSPLSLRRQLLHTKNFRSSFAMPSGGVWEPLTLPNVCLLPSGNATERRASATFSQLLLCRTPRDRCVLARQPYDRFSSRDSCVLPIIAQSDFPRQSGEQHGGTRGGPGAGARTKPRREQGAGLGARPRSAHGTGRHRAPAAASRRDGTADSSGTPAGFSPAPGGAAPGKLSHAHRAAAPGAPRRDRARPRGTRLAAPREVASRWGGRRPPSRPISSHPIPSSHLPRRRPPTPRGAGADPSARRGGGARLPPPCRRAAGERSGAEPSRAQAPRRGAAPAPPAAQAQPRRPRGGGSPPAPRRDARPPRASPAPPPGRDTERGAPPGPPAPLRFALPPHGAATSGEKPPCGAPSARREACPAPGSSAGSKGGGAESWTRARAEGGSLLKSLPRWCGWEG